MILYATDIDRTKRIVIDTYTSVEWEPSYNEEGNFELQLPKALADKIDFGMIIENSNDPTFQAFATYKEYDTAEGINSDVVIKGHFFIYKLYYRFVEGVEFTNTAFDTVIQSVLQPFKSGSRSFGRDLNVKYQDESIKSMKVDIKAENENLMNIVLELCQQLEIGVNLVLEDDSSMTLSFYSGEDKSEKVIVSLDMDTASEVMYYKDTANVGNYFYVLGQSFKDGETHVFEFWLDDSDPSDSTARSEVFVDLSDISRKDKNGEEIPLDKYKDMLWAKLMTNVDGVLGEEELESKIPNEYQGAYGTEYKMGDVITQEFKELSILMRSKITSVSQSWGEDGYEMTLTCVNKGRPNKGGVLTDG